MGTKTTRHSRTHAAAAAAIATAALGSTQAAVLSTARVHELKSWPEHFAPTASGLKPFEVRLDDRGFLPGDRLRLREWIPLGSGTGQYTGRELLLGVKGVLSNLAGLRDGYVAMAVEPIGG